MKLLLSAAFAALATAPAMADEIRIAHIHDMTGALEAYAAQSQTGLMLGLEYATDGTMQVDGHDLVVTEYDSQLRPDLGRALLAQAAAVGAAELLLARHLAGRRRPRGRHHHGRR